MKLNLNRPKRVLPPYYGLNPYLFSVAVLVESEVEAAFTIVAQFLFLNHVYVVENRVDDSTVMAHAFRFSVTILLRFSYSESFSLFVCQ